MKSNDRIAPVTGELRAAKPAQLNVRLISSKHFHRRRLTDAFDNFENRETTVSHMFRLPHPFLGDRAYGAAFHQALVRHEILRRGDAASEIGAGCGYFAAAFLDAARGTGAGRKRSKGSAASYTIFDLAPELIREQRKNISDQARVAWVQTDGEHLPVKSGTLTGAIIANEMIADLDAWHITPVRGKRARSRSIRITGRGATLPNAPRPAEVGEQLKRFGFHFDRTKRPVVFPIGLISLLDGMHRAMAPDATAVITEYFDPYNNGHVARMPKHDEVALSLPMVCHIAESCGFTLKVLSLIDFLNVSVDAPVVSHALRKLARDFLGEEYSHTLPAQEQVLAGLTDRDAWKKNPEFFDRAEIFRFIAQFYVLILRKRPTLEREGLRANLVMTREPGVIRISSGSGEPALVKSRPFRVRTINDSGAEIWRALDGRRTAAAVADRIAKIYGIGKQRARKDTMDFLWMLYTERMACPTLESEI